MAEAIDTVVARHGERIGTLEREMKSTRQELDQHIGEDHKELDKQMLTYATRPSWLVTGLIAFLFTLCGSLMTYLATH